jgi:P-type Na+/K+ transporter
LSLRYRSSLVVCQDDTDAQQLSRPAHLISPSIIANELNTDLDNGITEEEAVKRLEFYGQNQLEGGDGVSAIAILVRQLFNAMCLILVMAMVVSFAIKSWTEGVVVFLVLMLNVIVGFIQEYNAEKTMCVSYGSITIQV